MKFYCVFILLFLVSCKQPDPPQKYPDGAKKIGDKWYYVCEEVMTWHEARDQCVEYGGHLLTIESEEENRKILSLIKDYEADAFWIGLTDEGHEGNWVNIRGERLDYMNWGERQPDNYVGVEHYGQIRRKDSSYWQGTMCSTPGEWEDWTNHPSPFICEWE